jgi:nucleobase:cation symporter-1, NCS1 family
MSQPDTISGGGTTAGNAVEQHSIDYIPAEERHGNVWRQGPFWFVTNFNFFSIALGFVGPSLGLSVLWTVVAGVLGLVFGGLFMAFHGSQGPKLGLPQMIQARAQFGYRGVIVPTLAVVITLMTFNVLQTMVLQTGLNQIWGWNPVVVAVVCSVAAATLAIFGHDWLHRAFRILFWISLPLFALLTVGVLFGSVPTQSAPPAGFSASAFMAVFVISASYNITLAPDVSDYTRYLPANTKNSHIIATILTGASLSAAWLMALGAWLATRTGATDGLVAIYNSGNAMVHGFGTLMAVASAISLVAVIGINTYCTTLGVATMADSITPVNPTRALRVGIVIGLLVIWVGITLSIGENQTTLINDMLAILLYLLVPWTSVNLVDFFFVRKGHYAITEIFNREGIYGAWNWRGLTSYFVALACCIPFVKLSFYTSPMAERFNGIDTAWIVGLLVGGILYYVLSRSMDLAAEQSAIELSELELREGFEPADPHNRPDGHEVYDIKPPADDSPTTSGAV